MNTVNPLQKRLLLPKHHGRGRQTSLQKNQYALNLDWTWCQLLNIFNSIDCFPDTCILISIILNWNFHSTAFNSDMSWLHDQNGPM